MPRDGRVANSTLRRKTELAKGTKGLARGGKLREVNPEQAKKRAKRKASKAAKARRSAGYREAMARAGGRCETLLVTGDRRSILPDESRFPQRCPATEGLEAHHKTYSRYGGRELAEDFAILCPTHHALEESKHPTRRRRIA